MKKIKRQTVNLQHFLVYPFHNCRKFTFINEIFEESEKAGIYWLYLSAARIEEFLDQ